MSLVSASRLRTLASRLVRVVGYSGLPPGADIEVRQRVFLVNFFCVVGLGYLAVTGASAVLNGRVQLAVFLTVSALAALATFLYLRWTSDYRGAGHMVVGIVSVVFAYLICTGGVEGTGPLWCYSVVPLVLFLYGARRGLIWIAVLMAFAGLVLFVPDMPLLRADYSFAFKSRFMVSLAAMVMMSLLYEYAREASYRRMLALQLDARQEARTDPLTGLANRRHMFERIESVRTEAERRDCPFSLLLCDLDHFKRINDRHGHGFGDEVLLAVTRVFEDTLRGEDLIARWGGEEFLVLLPCTDHDAATRLAEKLRTRVEALELMHGGERVPVTLSIGVQQFDPALDVDRNIVAADRKLYLAKQQGRNRVVFETPVGTEDLA